jgi:hypothetical protein
MNFSHEWTDWHLTPSGWVKGSYKVDFKNEAVIEPPKDRVLTRRYEEIITSVSAPLKIVKRNIWDNGDTEIIKKFYKKFQFPNSLSVEKHALSYN